MDAQALLQRIYSDPVSHATFAEIVRKVCRLVCHSHTAHTNFDRKRFDTASSSFDVDTLGHISRVLAANETALDLVSLHVELSALISGAVAVVEEYDFEVGGMFWSLLLCVSNHGILGDPQSAVSNLGDIVLFVQLATARFKVTD